MPADLSRRPSGFVALFEEMQLLFDSFHVAVEHKWPTWRPAVDVLENEDNIVVLVELPGVPAEKIEVSGTEARLEVRGIRQPPESHVGADHHHVERCYGRFERRVIMPVPIDPVRITTELKDGVLTVVLPKK